MLEKNEALIIIDVQKAFMMKNGGSEITQMQKKTLERYYSYGEKKDG